MRQKIEIPPSEITVLGFHNAGWSKYCNVLRDSGVRVYTTTESIYDLQTSIYGKAHDEAVLVEKSLNKSKDPKSVESALMHFGGLVERIKEAETRKAIIQYISDIERIEEAEMNGAIDKVESGDNPTASMIEFVLEKTEYYDSLYSDENKVNLTGYTFARSLDTYNLEALFYGQDKQLVKEIKEWSGYVNINTKSIDIQQTLTQSKRLIVDTLQLNLHRLQNGEPIVPIHIVVSAERTNQHECFSPNWGLVTQKIGFVLTNAEIRMIYKLTHEIDDPLINSFMKENVTFINTLDHTFQPIPPPWEGNEEAWIERVRSKRKGAHHLRTAEEIQPWIKKLIALSKATGQELTRQTAHSSASGESTERMLRLMPTISPEVKDEVQNEQLMVSSQHETEQPKKLTSSESLPNQDEAEVEPGRYKPT